MAAFIYLHGQAPQAETHSVWDGVYSAKQAERGEALYHENCSSCHGDTLKGKADEDIPGLSGSHFSTIWNGRTVGDLFKKVIRTMPQDDPGRLSAQQTADIVSFILSFNLFPAGDADLAADDKALSGIRIETKRHDKKIHQ